MELILLVYGYRGSIKRLIDELLSCRFKALSMYFSNTELMKNDNERFYAMKRF